MKKLSILACLLALIACGKKEHVQVTVEYLRCELTVDPTGLNIPNPRLTWEIQSDGRGIVQTAYQILVASSKEKLNNNEGDLWNSGKVKSSSSVLVPYSGSPLASRTECFWKVRVWTNRAESVWSEPARWTTGIAPDDWQARWIGIDSVFAGERTDGATRLAARYLRREFQVAQQPVRATLYVSGLGLYKAFINGKKTGDYELAPTPTDYSKTVKYNTFDVTKLIAEGQNAIGVTLGNGRFFTMRRSNVRDFGLPRLLLQLEIEFADGSRQTVVSDESWRITADGPIRANNEYDGEEYDATREMPGWDSPGFNDAAWLTAEVVEAPGGVVEGQVNRNIKIMDDFSPSSIKRLKDGRYILDMGQNMVGWLQMRVKGRRGDRVTLRFAETLRPDGSLFLDNIRGAQVTDTYTLRGGEVETWQPQFTYHGFRYVEISGWPGEPTTADFTGMVVHDEIYISGTFVCSDTTLNRIYQNAYWGIRGNYRGMPTDCPQRDERMGWLGDRAVGSQGESFIFNINNLYAKWLDDIEQAQRPDGCIPDVAPNYWSVYNDNMTWPGAYVIIANMLYEQYGNTEPLIRHYDSMKRWIAYMKEKYLKDNIMTKDTYGDWCMPPERPELIHSQDPARKTDGAVLSTTFYYRILKLLEKFAVVQGKTADAQAFADEAAVIKDAFNAKYFNTETAAYSNNTVTANVLALCFGMVPEGVEDRVFANIVEKTEKDFNSHVSTGLVGIQWLMRCLTAYGRPDLALRIATNRDYPSWGYMIENDATTIWELWNGNTADPGMNSHNHVMLLGDLIVWYYECLAGIRNDPSGAGFERIVMHPYPMKGIEYVDAGFSSVRGLIRSNWTRHRGRFYWAIAVPCNSTATVYIPAESKSQVLESEKPATSQPGIKFLRMENGCAVFEVGSGEYLFESEKEKFSHLTDDL